MPMIPSCITLAKTFSRLKINYQKIFVILQIGFEDNELIINLKKGKSEVMLFGTSQKLGRLNETLNIKYRYHNINVTLV